MSRIKKDIEHAGHEVKTGTEYAGHEVKEGAKSVFSRLKKPFES